MGQIFFPRCRQVSFYTVICNFNPLDRKSFPRTGFLYFHVPSTTGFTVYVNLSINRCRQFFHNYQLNNKILLTPWSERLKGPQLFKKFRVYVFNPLNPELNPICYLLALLGAHHFLHVSRIRVKLLTFRLLMSYIYIWSTHSWCF